MSEAADDWKSELKAPAKDTRVKTEDVTGACAATLCAAVRRVCRLSRVALRTAVQRPRATTLRTTTSSASS